ncbi:hypothetical protein SLS62_007509 [Diatrype stigma]|uniref:Cellulose-binding family II n=1 Tax=Diatrype stigma TaxID=117547 RepID=A0AAN9UZ53_9PEZI
MKTTTALSALVAVGGMVQAHPFSGAAGKATDLQSPSTCSKADRSNAVRSTSTSTSTSSSKVKAAAASAAPAAEWEPPSNLSTALDEVWQHTMETYTEPLSFLNWGYDHLMDTGSNIQYCVRWDSSATVTAAQRAGIAAALQRSYGKWMSQALVGFDGFPYDGVNVTVVGWAATDATLLEGLEAGEGVTVYTDTRDADGVPECDPACGRAIHYGDGDYSGCAGGSAARYDVSLWLSASLDGNLAGYGGDWGQELPTDYMLDNLETDNIHILLHEMGHTLALDDFYDWTPDGVTSFIMKAGSAFEVTDFDAWMARDWWRHIKSRYGL